MTDLSSPTKNNVCVICLESLTSSNSHTADNCDECIGTCVPCGHCFHVSCFEGWKVSRRSHGQVVKCPTCNTKSKDFCRLFLDLSDYCEPTNDDDDDSSCSSSCDDEDCDVEFIGTSNDIEKNDNERDEFSNESKVDKENGSENDDAEIEEKNSDDDIRPFDIALLMGLSNEVRCETNNKKKRKRQDTISNDRTSESTKEDSKSKYKLRTKRYKQQLARMEAQSKNRIEECTKLLHSYNKQRTELSDVTNQLQIEVAQRKEYQRSNEMLYLQNVRIANQVQDLEREISIERKMYSELRTKYQQMEDSYRIDVENARATSLKEVQDMLQQRPKLIHENKTLKELLANKELEILKLKKQFGFTSANNNITTTKANNSTNTGVKAAKMLAKINNAIELSRDNNEKTKTTKDRHDLEIMPTQPKKPPPVFSSHAARMVSRASSMEKPLQQSQQQQRHSGSSQAMTTGSSNHKDSTISATQEAKNFVCSLMTQSSASTNKTKKQSFANFASNTQNKSFKTNGTGLSIREVKKPKHQLQLNFRR